MGRQKYPYWNYVKSIIKEYPSLLEQRDTPREPQISPVSNEQVASKGNIPNRPTEACVVHFLPKKAQRKLDAIERAILATKKLHPDDYGERLLLLDLVYWSRTHTIEGAALRIPCHRNTACAWNGEFIKLVAEALELV